MRFYQLIIHSSLIIFVSSCNPCRRIERLAQRYPDCFQAFARFEIDSGMFSLAPRDSAILAADSALNVLSDTVFDYLRVLADSNKLSSGYDSLAKVRVKSQFALTRKMVIASMQNTPCITDTITYRDTKGAVLKLWQSGDKIKYSLLYPVREYEQKKSAVGVRNFLPWWGWLIIGYVLATVVYGVGFLRR